MYRNRAVAFNIFPLISFIPWFRLICLLLVITFSSEVIGADAARAFSINDPQNIIMPPAGTLVGPAAAFSLPTLRAIAIDPNDPFKINFAVDAAPSSGQSDWEQINLLVKYFLSFLTLPEQDLWVNLSPYEKDRIITPDFENTNAGRDMLQEDYILKQLASSLTYPDHQLGKIFWKEVYDRARANYGTTDIPINTFNKVWVVPDKAVVYEGRGSAFISESHLKVLVEEDYLSVYKHHQSLQAVKSHDVEYLSSEITRKIIIPELEHQVNDGKYFASLRQMYTSLILAIWFKKRLQEHLINQVYVDRKKTYGITLNEKQIKERIYRQYLKAFKKGAYNFIREDYDQDTHQVVPRKYFSGGFSFAMTSKHIFFLPAFLMSADRAQIAINLKGSFNRFTIELSPLGDKGMISKKTLLSLWAGGLILIGSIGQANAQPVNNTIPSAVVQLGHPLGSGGMEQVEKDITVLKEDIAIKKDILHKESMHGGERQVRLASLGYEENELAKLQEQGRSIDAVPSSEVPESLGSPKGVVNSKWSFVHPFRDVGNIVGTPFKLVTPTSWGKGRRTIDNVTHPLQYGAHVIDKISADKPQEILVTPIPEIKQSQTAAPTIEPTVSPQTLSSGGVLPPEEKVTSTDIPLLQPSIPTATVTVPSSEHQDSLSKPQSKEQVADSTGNQTTTTAAVSGGTPPPENNPFLSVASGAPTTVFSAPAISTSSGTGQKNITTNTGSYHISIKLVPTPVEDHVVAKNNGIVTGLNPDKKDYKQGETIFFLLDPELNSRIESLNAQLKIRKEYLTDLKELYSKQAATLQEVTIGQKHIDDISKELARAYEEQAAGKVTAPHNLNIKVLAVADGMKVVKGNNLFTYYDEHRVRFNFEVPLSVSYFDRLEGFSINGEPIQSIENIDWSPDPLERTAQVSLVAVVPSSIPQETVELKGNILPPVSDVPQLYAITRGVHTVASVKEVEQYVIRTPVDGPVQFLVHDGQKVQAGQLLAVVDPQHYLQEAQSLKSSIGAIDIQLNQAADMEGTLLITRDKLDDLKEQRILAVSKLATLKDQFRRMHLRASHSGTVEGLTIHESQVFQSGDELLRIRTGEALIGDINGIQNSLLFPKSVIINNTDPVLVETPQGVHLVGRVVAINQNPFNAGTDLSGYQSLQVQVFDPQNILRPNLPVSVILPNDSDKNLILNYLSEVARKSDQNVSSGGSPPPDEIQEGVFDLQSIVTNKSPLTNTVNGTSGSTVLQTNGQPSLNLTEVERRVAANELVVGNDVLKVYQAKAAEAFPKESSLSLTGGVYVGPNGKLAYSGGIFGTFHNAISGGVTSGTAIGAASPIVFELAGNVIKIVSGQVKKETALAVERTKIVYHQMQIGINHHVNTAQDLLVDVGAIEQKIELTKNLVDELKKVKSLIEAREAVGLSLEFDREQVQNKIQEYESQLLAFKEEKDRLMATLNFYVSESNTFSNRLFSPVLPWGKSFETIDTATENIMLEKLIGQESLNPRMQEAVAENEASKMTLQLQKLDKLPAINLGSVIVNQPAGTLNPFESISEPFTGQRSSTLQGGANSGGQISVNLFDTGLKTKEKIASSQKKGTELRIAQTKAELTEEFTVTVGDIRNLSEQIKQAQEEFTETSHSFELKAKHPDVYRPDQLVNERMELLNLEGRILDFKAKYLKAEAELRELGVLGQDESAQNLFTEGQMISNFTNVVSNAVSTGTERTFPALSLTNTQIAGTQTLTAGTVNYQVSDPTIGWALMHGAPSSGTNADSLVTIRNILVEDPNIFTRQDALRHFLTEYQNNDRFQLTAQHVVQNSPHEEIIWGILNYMISHQDDHGVHFLVQVLKEASDNNNQRTADLGFQALGDIFTIYPDFVQGLSQSDFTSAETAQKVFLTFLLREPAGSIGQERLLQSSYWNTEDLVGIYKNLTAHGENHLAGLIHDTLLRRTALENINETFRPGDFDHLGLVVLERDVVTDLEIKATVQDNVRFLNTSPQWQDMQRFIYPNLYTSAQETLTNLMQMGSIGSSNAVVYTFPQSPNRHNELASFESLGLDKQKQYISTSQNISELVRILSRQTPLRIAVLDRLTADYEGRILVLKAYSDSNEEELLKLIETRPWIKTMRADIQAVKYSAENLIIQQALEKLYTRTHQEWTLNMRLATFSNMELHSNNDLRGDSIKNAQIKVAATRIAVKALEEMQNYKWVLWPRAGYRLQSPPEVDELAQIHQILDKETDPHKINVFIDNHAKNVTSSKAKKMYQFIISTRDKVALKIGNNDQTIPSFTFVWKVAGISVILGSAILGIKRLFKKIKLRIQNKDVVNNILHIADQVTSLEHFDALNGNGHTVEPDIEMIKTRSDGLRIIKMPEPITVEPKAQSGLKDWWRIIVKWNNDKAMSSEDIVNDFHEMTKSALASLKAIPYDPKMMQSPSGQYQKTLFYYTTMGNYSLYLLSKNLANNALTDEQRLQLKHDIDKLVKSIRYAANFSLFLHYRANIQRVLTRKLPDNYFLEKKFLLGKSLYGWARWFLLFEHLFTKSNKEGNKSLDNLLEEGHELLGIYPDRENIITDSKMILRDIVARGGMDQVVRAHTAEITDKIGNFWREIKYPIQAGIVSLCAVGLLLGIPGVASIAVEISVFSLMFLFWSCWFYSKPNLDFLNTKWSREINDLAGKQQKALNGLVDAAQLSLSEKSDAAMVSRPFQNSIETLKLDEIDKRVIAQLMTGYSADAAKSEQFIQQLQRNLAGEGANVIVENANLKRVFYLIRLFKEDSLLNRIKKSNGKEILFMSSLRTQEDFRPTTIENLNRDLPVMHINVGVREYYFIVGAMYPTLVRMKDAAMHVAIARRGGVDFSKAESSILFQQNSFTRSNIPSMDTETVLLRSFKGFEFKVIQYQPVVNPVKLFLGTSEGNQGAWFNQYPGAI